MVPIWRCKLKILMLLYTYTGTEQLSKWRSGRSWVLTAGARVDRENQRKARSNRCGDIRKLRLQDELTFSFTTGTDARMGEVLTDICTHTA